MIYFCCNVKLACNRFHSRVHSKCYIRHPVKKSNGIINAYKVGQKTEQESYEISVLPLLMNLIPFLGVPSINNHNYNQVTGLNAKSLTLP
jgi:hypothetical protein